MRDMEQSSESQSTSPEEAADRPQPGATSGGQRGRKRKVTDPVTPNACTNCKKARTKVCDSNVFCPLFESRSATTGAEHLNSATVSLRHADVVPTAASRTNAGMRCIPKLPRSRWFERSWGSRPRQNNWKGWTTPWKRRIIGSKVSWRRWRMTAMVLR